MDFGRPNAEIGRKMANGQQLLLALYLKVIYLYFQFLIFCGSTLLLTIFNSLKLWYTSTCFRFTLVQCGLMCRIWNDSWQLSTHMCINFGQFELANSPCIMVFYTDGSGSS